MHQGCVPIVVAGLAHPKDTAPRRIEVVGQRLRLDPMPLRRQGVEEHHKGRIRAVEVGAIECPSPRAHVRVRPKVVEVPGVTRRAQVRSSLDLGDRLRRAQVGAGALDAVDALPPVLSLIAPVDGATSRVHPEAVRAGYGPTCVPAAAPLLHKAGAVGIGIGRPDRHGVRQIEVRPHDGTPIIRPVEMMLRRVPHGAAPVRVARRERPAAQLQAVHGAGDRPAGEVSHQSRRLGGGRPRPIATHGGEVGVLRPPLVRRLGAGAVAAQGHRQADAWRRGIDLAAPVVPRAARVVAVAHLIAAREVDLVLSLEPEGDGPAPRAADDALPHLVGGEGAPGLIEAPHLLGGELDVVGQRIVQQPLIPADARNLGIPQEHDAATFAPYTGGLHAEGRPLAVEIQGVPLGSDGVYHHVPASIGIVAACGGDHFFFVGRPGDGVDVAVDEVQGEVTDGGDLPIVALDSGQAAVGAGGVEPDDEAVPLQRQLHIGRLHPLVRAVAGHRQPKAAVDAGRRAGVEALGLPEGVGQVAEGGLARQLVQHEVHARVREVLHHVARHVGDLHRRQAAGHLTRVGDDAPDL